MPTVLFLAISAQLHAGFIKTWQLKETAEAPVIVVGRVTGIQRQDLVPPGSLGWQAETWNMIAEVEVLRSAGPIGVNTIRVHFLAYGPSGIASINGFPPPLPQLKPGEVLIFPLKANTDSLTDSWQLTADSGVDLLIPSHADLADNDTPPANPRAFLLREIANTLSRGTPAELSSLSRYLTGQNDDLADDLLPLMQLLIGAQRQPWIEIAANVIAAQGIPRPSVAELFSETPPALRGNLSMARAALRKLGSSPATDELLINAWISEAPLNAWGSANSLAEFANDRVTTETLRRALRDDLPGSSYVALVLAHAGNKSILPDALKRALKVVDRPGSDPSDLQGGAALLRDYGSDQDLNQLASLVRKYQIRDLNYYHALWQNATESGNPREVRVLAVVLLDRRIVFQDMRYCDYALGVLDRATGQHFSALDLPLEERDAAISKALNWIQSQGLVN